MVGTDVVSNTLINRMTSLELPPIKTLTRKDASCPTKTRTISFQRSILNRSSEFSDCTCTRYSLTSSSSGCSNPNVSSRCKKCNSEKKFSKLEPNTKIKLQPETNPSIVQQPETSPRIIPQPETNPRIIPQPKIQRGTMRREMTWHSGAANRSMTHSNSSSSMVTNGAVTSSPRLKPLRSTNTSAKTSTSGEKLTIESGSSHTDGSIAHVNSYNSLTSLKDRLPGTRCSRLSVPRSPRLGANSAVVGRRSLSQTRPGSSQVAVRRICSTEKIYNGRSTVSKGVISRNQKNEQDTSYARDTEQRIISWLIGVEDSKPDEPLAPFLNYEDVPLQTDTAIHIVYQGD